MENKIKIGIAVDSSGLDIALKKAERLKVCLKEVDQLLASIQVKVPEATKESNNGISTHRELQTIGFNQGPSMCDVNSILEELTQKLREVTKHIAC